MRQIILSFLLSTWLVGVAVAEPVNIRVGAIFGLTGAYSRYAEWGMRTLKLAAENWNRDPAHAETQITLKFEDHSGQASKAVSAYAKLRQEGVRYYLTSTSSVALALSPLVKRDQAVQIEISATSPKYSSPNDCTFRTSFLAKDLARVAASRMLGQFHVVALGLLAADNEYGQGIYETLEEQLGEKLIARERYLSDGTDFRPELLRLRKANPDALWITGAMRETAEAVRKARNLGFSVPIFSDAISVEAPDFLVGAGASAEGLIYFSPRVRFSEASRDFAAAYQARFKESPNYYVAQAYDAIQALFQAFGACSGAQEACVCLHMQQAEFAGAAGQLKFDENGDLRREMEVKAIRGGQFVGIEK